MIFITIPLLTLAGHEPEKEEEVTTYTDTGNGKKLVLFDDDFNTFDFVIACLIDICALNEHQAEQLTMLVHYKGRATVKEGDEEKLSSMCRQLCDQGLTAEVQ